MPDSQYRGRSTIAAHAAAAHSRSAQGVANARLASNSSAGAPASPIAVNTNARSPSSRRASAASRVTATASAPIAAQVRKRQSCVTANSGPYRSVSRGLGVVVTKASIWRPARIRSKWITETAASNATGPAANGRAISSATPAEIAAGAIQGKARGRIPGRRGLADVHPDAVSSGLGAAR